MRMLTLLTMTLFILVISGCAPRVITKVEYVEAQKYEFQKIDLSGSKIDINPTILKLNEEKVLNGKSGIIIKKDSLYIDKKTTRTISTPYLIIMSDNYKKVLKHYTDQIDEYNKQNKKDK